MIKSRLKIFIFLPFYFFLFSNLFGVENKIIAKVNNEIITSYELKNNKLLRAPGKRWMECSCVLGPQAFQNPADHQQAWTVGP